MAKILVVDDDFDLCDMVREWLSRRENYTVETANNGNDALAMLQCSRYDVIVLDWELPDISGIDICKRVRTAGDEAPVLFLTGRTALLDKEVGFNAGGDDYLVKPFELKELSMRVKALLRRHKAISEGIICIRDLEMDPKSRRLMRYGQELHLSPKEFSLLEFFMRHPNEVFKPADLLRHVWPSDTEATDQTVRTTIKRLRHTIDPPDGSSYIANVHGHGYRMNKD
jgi:DNA-binding response OmpR family regulator